MEIIEMRSYLDFEKVQIALKHIIPKVLIEHGMDNTEINFTDDAILKIIHDYTKEAGVRNLEREISSIIRKIAKSKVQNINLKQRKFLINAKKIGEYLGVTRYFSRKRIKGEKNKIGSVYGLAWTSLGGDILNIDVTVMKGENKLILTGQLGDVMKESALAGLSYIKSNSKKFKIPDNYFKDKEIHIHLPEGAIPKDGPSAGITMIIAMLSAVTGNAIYSDVAMTGEITLRGDVLAVGGLNEKLLAAQRNEIKTILIPKDNGKDLSEVPDEIKKNLDIILIDNVNNALEYAFVNKKVIFNNQ
jgi:ATP-dependent Lon protease